MAWFPRPSGVDVIHVDPTARLDAATLWALLHGPTAEEWPHRVGVVGARDGSAKPTVRLLRSDAYVLKTDLAVRWDRLPDALDAVHQSRARARAFGLWHPDKEYFVFAHRGGWLAASICPELTTLRQLTSVDARIDAWTELCAFALQASRRHAVGLDLNPANFGRDAEGTLHYIDDECYAQPTRYAEVGEFVAARLLEEDGLQAQARARSWGQRLARALRNHGASARDLATLAEYLVSYPLPQRREAARRALIGGLLEHDRGRVPKVGSRRFVCVLADVHANLPALEAVLTAVRSVGVDRFLVLGDVVGYGPHPAECIDRLAELEGARVLRGNHDDALESPLRDCLNRDARWAIDWTQTRLSAAQRQWLGALPLEVRDPDMLAVHGAPRDPTRLRAYVYQLTFRENLDHLRERGIRLCFHGHTHVPFAHAADAEGYHQLGSSPVECARDGRTLLVNPGSVGQPRDGDTRAAFALWDLREARIRFHRVPYPVEHTTHAMGRLGFPDDLIHRLSLGR